MKICVQLFPQRTIGALQGHILSFTQRLHAAEVDRRSLRLELSKNKQEAAELKSAQASADSQYRQTKDAARALEERIQELKEEVSEECFNTNIFFVELFRQQSYF